VARESGEADTLQRILHEAARLFVALGYEGVSMREIGEAVGITKAALYYHFPDKESLFMAIVGASLEEISGVLDRAEQAGPDARTRIGAAVRGLLDLPGERRALIRVASQEMVHVNPEVRLAFNEVYQQRFVGRIAAMLADGMERGELCPIEPQLAAWLLLGMAYPFLQPVEAAAIPEITAALLGVFFDGLSSNVTRNAARG
jgi:AcrR family transcriptional regulator